MFIINYYDIFFKLANKVKSIILFIFIWLIKQFLGYDLAKENDFQKGEIVIYTSEDGSISLDTKLENDTIWLSQKQMAELFDKNVRTINEHINNIFKEDELDKNSVIRNFQITANDGKNYWTFCLFLENLAYNPAYLSLIL